MGLHLENEVAVVKTQTIILNNPAYGKFRTSFSIELSTVPTVELQLHERQGETVPQVKYTYTGP